MKVCDKPCKECPFRVNSAPGWIGPYETPQDLLELIQYERPFPCHLTMGSDEDNGKAMEEILCKGSVLYMRKMGKLPRSADLYRAVKAANGEDLSNILSLPDFISHHTITKKKKKKR